MGLKLTNTTFTKNEVLAVFKWLYDHRRISAWIAFVILLISSLFSWPVVNIVSLILYLAIITATVLDIHRHIEPPITRFSSHSVANPEMFSEIDKAIKQGLCELSWVGVTMQSAWLTLENRLQP